MTAPQSRVSVAELRRDFMVGGSQAPVFNPAKHADSRIPATLAIGVFDGYHRGHQRLLAEAFRDARRRSVSAIVVTFDPDPDEILSSIPAKKLLGNDARIDLLARSGADGVACLPFTHALATLDHRAFFEDVLGTALDIRSIHVGADFRLGRGGEGSVSVIRSWAQTVGIEVVGHELLLEDEVPITSTRIRSLIEAGDLDAAARLLARRYSIEGVVERGRGEGRAMGFPTANIGQRAGQLLPPDGAYAGWAQTPDGLVWPAAINVGIPPMFAHDPASASLEATLLGFSGNLYGSSLRLVFDTRLRPSHAFEMRAELIEAVQADLASVRARLGDDAYDISLRGEEHYDY
ncbi:riboflavin biosynthesis protein RibF [Collinsella sp. AGMB00827]|uniref:Riboflavin biosynthesis protein n=1 Tax=Collinsella ureilytica TaxID=2869515 RepID=A0ABS7MKQ3_9ACTN|nr:riboflavin biosynthesis protein RibF [Collinsella urealyticum]MBY4797951.1 riboflavin biosynthesis protein RibF [Collinsella urealyticum]